MALSVPINAGFLAVDTSTTAKTIIVPLSTEPVGRTITFKDSTGNAATNNITLLVQGADVFENGNTTYVINQNFGAVTLTSRNGVWVTQQTTQWSKYPASSKIILNSNQALIENPSNETVTTIQTGYLEVRDSFQTPGILSLGLAGFYTSTNNGVYILGQYEQLTGSVSSFGLGYSAPDSLWLNTGSLYLSSLYLGGIGGSTYGQLTTDGTASDIYWNGTSLTSGGGGITEANLVSTTSGLQTNFIGQQASLSTLFMNMSPSTAPFWDSNTQIAGYDPEPNPLAVDVFGSLRVLKNLYIGSTTTKIGTAGIETSLLYTSTITALSLISSANILASTFTLIDTNTAASQTLAVSSGTLTLNGFGISGGGGSGDVTTAQLVSTVTNFQDDFKTQKISTGFVQASTINLLDRFTNATNYLTVSTGTLLLNGGFITGSGGSAVSQILAGSNISVSPAGGTGVVEINTTINPTGLVSTANLSGLVSTPNLQNLVSTGFFDNRLVSTVAGLGQIYVSTTSLISTVAGLGRNYVSTPSLVSTVAGLGQRYLSSFSSFSTSIGTSFTSQTGYFNTLTASNATFSNVTVSTLTFNTGDGYISMPDVVALSLSTFVMNTCTINVGFWVSTQVLNASTILSPSLVSPSELASTVIGLGTSGYISSASLIGLVSTPNLVNLVSTANLSGFLSTGSVLNYVSTANLIGLVSTPNLLNLVSTNYFASQLVSTVAGLGVAGYISTSQLESTVVGLGTAGYVSTSQLVSTNFGITSNYSTFISETLNGYQFPFSGAELYLNYSLNVPPYQQLGISNIIGPSYSNVFSIPLNSSNNYVTGFQSDFFLPAFLTSGLWTTTLFCQADNNGAYVYATLFDRTPGGVESVIGTSSNSPFIVPLTKVSLALTVDVPYYNLSTGNTLVLKIFANNTTNQTRTLTTFYENGNYSYVTTTLGQVVATSYITSTIAGLGTLGYVSSSQLVSTVAGLGTAGYVSTASLVGLVSTANLLNLVSTANLSGLVSTPNLLNLVSTPFLNTSLVSTTIGLQTYISTFIDPVELASTVSNLISTTAFQNALTSTVGGLGAAGYISSLSTIQLSTGSLLTRNVALTDINTNNQNLLTVSSGVLLLNGQSVGSGGGGGGASLTASDFVVGGRLAADQSLTADVDNTIEFIDDFDPRNWYNASTYFFTPSIAGYYLVTFQVWFNTGAVSNNQYNIQIQKNSGDSYAITQFVQNTVTGTSLNATKIIYMNGSTDNLRFRAYVGNTSNTTAKAQQGNSQGTGTFFTAALLTNGSDGGNLISTVAGLGTAGYISSSQLLSTTAGLVLPINLASTVTGLGTAGYVSTSMLVGHVSTPNLLNLISTANLSGLVSTPNLLNLVSTTYLTSQLVSTIIGLSNVAVTQIIAGSNVSISPAGGLGAVTINGNAAGLLTIPANLSTSAFFTSSIEASTTRSRILSTGLTTASTVLLYDPLSGNTGNNFIVASTFFYFNNFIIGGTRVAQPQWVVF